MKQPEITLVVESADRASRGLPCPRFRLGIPPLAPVDDSSEVAPARDGKGRLLVDEDVVSRRFFGVLRRTAGRGEVGNGS